MVNTSTYSMQGDTWSRTVSVIDMFISGILSSTLANSHLAIVLVKHVARLRMRPRRAREAIMRIRIPSTPGIYCWQGKLTLQNDASGLNSHLMLVKIVWGH